MKTLATLLITVAAPTLAQPICAPRDDAVRGLTDQTGHTQQFILSHADCADHLSSLLKCQTGRSFQRKEPVSGE